MRLNLVVAATNALWATSLFGAQYECEDGTIAKRARTAAPSALAVNIDADKGKKTCFFRINGEPVDLNETPITKSSSGGSSGGGGTTSDRSQAAARGAIEAFRMGNVELDAKVLAPLLFGANPIPVEFARAIDNSGAKDAFRECIAARGRPDRVQKAVKGVACGNTGTSAEPVVVDQVRAASDRPMNYFSVTVGDRQSIIFFPQQPR
jgi:hypothetical protein